MGQSPMPTVLPLRDRHDTGTFMEIVAHFITHRNKWNTEYGNSIKNKIDQIKK